MWYIQRTFLHLGGWAGLHSLFLPDCSNPAMQLKLCQSVQLPKRKRTKNSRAATPDATLTLRQSTCKAERVQTEEVHPAAGNKEGGITNSDMHTVMQVRGILAAPSRAGPRERAQLMVTVLSLGTVHTDCVGICPTVPRTVSSCVRSLYRQGPEHCTADCSESNMYWVLYYGRHSHKRSE
jgi:hypothetical protein